MLVAVVESVVVILLYTKGANKDLLEEYWKAYEVVLLHSPFSRFGTHSVFHGSKAYHTRS